jgi:hypothetical protein
MSPNEVAIWAVVSEVASVDEGGARTRSLLSTTELLSLSGVTVALGTDVEVTGLRVVGVDCFPPPLEQPATRIARDTTNAKRLANIALSITLADGCRFRAV